MLLAFAQGGGELDGILQTVAFPIGSQAVVSPVGVNRAGAAVLLVDQVAAVVPPVANVHMFQLIEAGTERQLCTEENLIYLCLPFFNFEVHDTQLPFPNETVGTIELLSISGLLMSGSSRLIVLLLSFPSLSTAADSETSFA